MAEAGYEFQSDGVIEMLEKLEVQFKEDGTFSGQF